MSWCGKEDRYIDDESLTKFTQEISRLIIRFSFEFNELCGFVTPVIHLASKLHCQNIFPTAKSARHFYIMKEEILQ